MRIADKTVTPSVSCNENVQDVYPRETILGIQWLWHFWKVSRSMGSWHVYFNSLELIYSDDQHYDQLTIVSWVCNRQLLGNTFMSPSQSVPVLEVPIPTPSPQHFQILSPCPPHSRSSHPHPHTVPAGLHPHPRPRPQLQLLIQLHVHFHFFTVSFSRFQLASVRLIYYYAYTP